MIKLEKDFKKIISIIIVFFMFLTPFTKVFAGENQSYDYIYSGVEKYGDTVGESSTALMNIKDKNNKTYKVYCIDNSKEIKGNSKYAIKNLEDAGYYSIENANKIRNIVINAYPFISIEQIRTFTGINNLTEKEAITGTQAAIWNYSNSKEDIKLQGNTQKLFNWYINLPNRVYSQTNIGDIDIKKSINIINDKYEITISYKINGKNTNGSSIDGNYTFNKDIAKIYKAKVEQLGKDANGYNIIKVTNISKDAKFEFNVKANQELSKNVYIYSPEGGKDASQNLVGVNSNKISIQNNINIDLSSSGYSLTIHKIDSKNSNGILGAEFKISSNREFTENVVTAITKEDGKVTIDGLDTGNWYIKETKAPNGYIPNNDIQQIYINEANIQIDIKNSKYGNAEIQKIDENNNPIKGAKFIVYKGNTISEENIIINNLISDSNGKIVIPNLLPGNYTLLETDAPEGYIINNEFIEFEVKPYETTKITHVNETIGYSEMDIVKRDAVTKEQLEGAKIGIYSDSEYKNLIKEVTTSSATDIMINDLRPGTYYVKELQAPKGYLLDSAPKKITLEKNQKAEVEFLNSKNYSTAGNYASILIIGFSVLFIGITFIYINKKSINKRRENN